MVKEPRDASVFSCRTWLATRDARRVPCSVPMARGATALNTPATATRSPGFAMSACGSQPAVTPGINGIGVRCSRASNRPPLSFA